jgi:hypothetical protein
MSRFTWVLIFMELLASAMKSGRPVPRDSAVAAGSRVAPAAVVVLPADR